MKQYLLKVWMTAALSLLVVGGVWGQTAPTVVSLSPADGAPGVSLTDDLVITFDQDIRFGSEGFWWIRIKEYNSDNKFQSFIVSGEDTNENLSIFNNQLVISHNQFAEGVRYYVTIDADAIESLEGVGIGGLSSKDEWDFTTETLPISPMVSALLPLDGATGVSLTDDLVITFDQDIRFGSEGFWWIRIKEYNSDNTFQSFIVSGEDTDENLSIFNNQLVISHNKFAEGVRYYVTIGADAIESLEGVGIGGLSSKDEWDFTTETLPISPMVSALLPLDGATGVSLTDDLVITFDQDIRFGSEGFWWIRIKEYNSDNKFQSFIVSGEDTNENLSIFNNQLVISHNQFAEGVRYYVTIDAGTVVSQAGVDFPGITNKDVWSFTTEILPVPPVVVENGYLPASGAIEVPIKGSLTLTFNKDVEFGVNNELFLIYRDGGQPKSFVVSGEHVSISEDNRELIVDLSGSPLNYETEYYVVIEEGFVRSVSDGAPYEGIKAIENTPISGQVWHFKTESCPPLWQKGYPKLSNMSASGFDLEVLADYSGHVYGVITMSPIAPAPDSIAASKNHYGDPAIMFINEVVESTIDPTIVNVEFSDNDDVFYLHVVYRRSISGELSKYGEVRTLVIDRRAPRVTDTYPTDGCLAFPVDGKIVVNFSERVQDINGNSLSVDDFVLLMMDGVGYSEVEFSVINSVVNERARVTITPDTILTGLSTYKLIIPQVKDLSGNSSAKVDTVNFETDGLFTWTGEGEDANWLNVNNWGGVLPGAGKSVLISDGAGNYPTISEGVIAVNNLTIEPGASITHTGGTLNVAGKFLLQSSNDGNASYINKGGTINVVGDSVRVEQYFENPILTFLISSPTKGTSAANFGGYYPLSVYDNKTDTWPNVGIQETMSPGIGYRMWTLKNLVYFSGQLNSESITIDLTRTNGKGYGWNLVGNPYPAGLDWSLLDVDENSLVEDNFWLWMPTDKKYGAYSVATDIPINIESSVIPSNHAFLVKVKLNNSEASLTFNPSAQVVSSGNYLKSASGPSVPYVKLAGVSGSVKDEMAVAFIDDASFTDDKYDLEKRFANQQSVFELYTNAGSVQAAINAIPLNGTYTLPLGYNALKSGSYGIEMVRDNTDNVSCVLIDKELGVERVMSRGDKYEFAVNKAEKNINRFELKFTNIITSNKPINQSQLDFELFSKDQGIYISYNPSDVTMNFEIIDIYGRALGAGVLSGNHNVLLGVFDKGVYIVRITDDTGRVSESRKVAVY